MNAIQNLNRLFTSFLQEISFVISDFLCNFLILFTVVIYIDYIFIIRNFIIIRLHLKMLLFYGKY